MSDENGAHRARPSPGWTADPGHPASLEERDLPTILAPKPAADRRALPVRQPARGRFVRGTAQDEPRVDQPLGAQQTELAVGSRVADLQLVEQIADGKRIACWRAERKAAGAATLHVLRPGARERERKLFLGAAERLLRLTRDRAIHGVAQVVTILPAANAYVVDVSAVGTMLDLPALGWGLPEKITFFGRLCATLSAMHAAGLFHGCLWPGNVLLDDDLRPVLSDAGVLTLEQSFGGLGGEDNEYAVYAAREVRLGQPADARSDIFSVGRLLHFLLLGEASQELDEPVAKLDALASEPAGLVRIVRRCTTRDPDQRYATVDELIEDLGRFRRADGVGLTHPQGKEGTEQARVEPKTPTVDAAKPDAAAEAARKRMARSEREPAESPPGRTSGRTSSRDAATRPVQDARRSGQEEPEAARRPLTLAVLGGVLLVLGGGVLGYRTGVASGLASALSVLGALGVSLAVPRIGPGPLASRIVVALVLVAGILWLDPNRSLAERGRRAMLQGGSPESRAAAVRRLRAKGATSFAGVDLHGSDLRRLDLQGVDLDGANLSATRLDDSKLDGATLRGADLAGADASGASLRGIDVGLLRGWSEMRCNAATVMPDGWRCADGAPVSARASAALPEQTAAAAANSRLFGPGGQRRVGVSDGTPPKGAGLAGSAQRPWVPGGAGSSRRR